MNNENSIVFHIIFFIVHGFLGQDDINHEKTKITL